MSIFRGPGGAGNATTDSEITLLTQLEQSASTSAASAANNASNASTSAINAAASAAAAAISESNAAATAASINISNFVDRTTNQTIDGIKTFSNTIVGSINGNAATVTNGVTLAGTQTLTNKTVEKLILNYGYTEEVFVIPDGSTVNLDPNKGSIQTWTLGANRTPGQANWAAGQSITLMIDDGSARTITWSTLGVVWETNGGTAPSLATSGFTVIVLWKVGSTIYGARVGDA
jgi:hypothetical protein